MSRAGAAREMSARRSWKASRRSPRAFGRVVLKGIAPAGATIALAICRVEKQAVLGAQAQPDRVTGLRECGKRPTARHASEVHARSVAQSHAKDEALALINHARCYPVEHIHAIRGLLREKVQAFRPKHQETRPLSAGSGRQPDRFIGEKASTFAYPDRQGGR